MRLSIKMMAFAAISLTTGLAAQAGTFIVEVGKTEALKLKKNAASVALCNPNVADVAVHSSTLLFISGKSFGTTNLLIMDNDGHTIYSADVVVTSNASNLVTVNRAGSDYSYDCAPNCRAGMVVGDNSEHFVRAYSQIKQQKELNE